MFTFSRSVYRNKPHGSFIKPLWLCTLLCWVLTVLFFFLAVSPTVNASDEQDTSVYEYIQPGSIGQNVLAVQSRLMELGYYQDGNRLTPSLYDEATQQAIQLFCETNHIATSGTILTPGMQHILFSEGVKPYSVPEVHQSLSEQFFHYMSGSTAMFDTDLPTYLVWLFSGLLIVLILILAVHFFVPDFNHEKRKEQPKETGQYWRATQALKQDGDVVTQKRIHGGASRRIDIQICYGSEVRSIPCCCPPNITIGRGNCVVILDSSDLSASSSHCEIAFRGAVPVVRDHSTNGTYVNKNYLHHAECRLYSGDRLKIGAHEVLVEF